jgi:hypothetical protein
LVSRADKADLLWYPARHLALVVEPEIGYTEEFREGGLGFEERLLDVSLEEIGLVPNLGRLEALKESEDGLVLPGVLVFRVVASKEAPSHRPLQVLGVLEECFGEGGLEA